MQGDFNEQELKDRLTLIENMIAEGRRSTESWGWTFVLWGVAYYIALAWSVWSPSVWAWPMTIVAAVIVTFVGVTMKAGSRPETTLGRASMAIWTALGISMFVLFLAMGLTGRLADVRVFISVASAILGMANGASGIILRWKMQFACAVVWWAAAALSCIVNESQSLIVFLVAIFFCQIVFGIYGMIAEARERKRQAHNGPAHA
jgi:hypothetical protein